ncbi:MAG: methyltransferase domain-containing protein [Pseudomonadales bacterium]
MTKLRLRYQTIEFGQTDIHLCTLRDKQQFHDPAGIAENLGISSALWPLFGVVWPSSLVLAHFMADCQTGSRRILEVGCGMALSSLLLNKLKADITATDYHPEAANFLLRNTQLNDDSAIRYEQANWQDSDDTLGLFDLIIGSDVLYEDRHILLLAAFIDRHARPDCEVILVDPGRGRKNKLSTRMIELGYSASQFKPPHTDYLADKFTGHIIKFTRG